MKTHKEKKATVSYFRDNRNNVVPLLRISGKWLDQAGFKPGTKTRIVVFDDQLIIEKVKTKEERVAEIREQIRELTDNLMQIELEMKPQNLKNEFMTNEC